MPTLLDLGNKFQEIYDRPDFDETTLDILEDLDGSMNDKIDGYGSLIDELNGDIEKMKAMVDKINERKKVAENKVKALKEKLAYDLKILGKDKVKTSLHSVYFLKTQVVDIQDEAKIPDKYIENTPKILRTNIKEAIKNGEEVTGAALKENESLVIR